jgi:hypothetical protein
MRGVRSRWLAVFAAGAALACAPDVLIASDSEASGAAAERLLADSVADFSLVQGEHGWYYGFDDGNRESFELLTEQSTIRNFVAPTGEVWDCWTTPGTQWTQIFRLGAHSNGLDTSVPAEPLLQRAVRRWVSSVAADVVISGELAKIDVAVPSNGVDGLLLVDGAVLYSGFIGGDDGAGLDYEANATLRVGSTVDLVLDPHDSDDHHDLSRFTSIIERRP